MGATIRLRPVVEDDLPSPRRFETEPDALGEFEWFGFADPGELDRRLREDGFLGVDGGCLIATTEDGATPAGVVTWRKTHQARNGSACWNIGAALLPEHRGRGLGVVAQALLARYLFETGPVERLEAGTDVENVAEQRALERAGFQREGVLRSLYFRAGRWRDTILYSRLRSDRAGDAQRDV